MFYVKRSTLSVEQELIKVTYVEKSDKTSKNNYSLALPLYDCAADVSQQDFIQTTAAMLALFSSISAPRTSRSPLATALLSSSSSAFAFHS